MSGVCIQVITGKYITGPMSHCKLWIMDLLLIWHIVCPSCVAVISTCTVKSCRVSFCFFTLYQLFGGNFLVVNISILTNIRLQLSKDTSLLCVSFKGGGLCLNWNTSTVYLQNTSMSCKSLNTWWKVHKANQTTTHLRMITASAGIAEYINDPPTMLKSLIISMWHVGPDGSFSEARTQTWSLTGAESSYKNGAVWNVTGWRDCIFPVESLSCQLTDVSLVSLPPSFSPTTSAG